MLKPEQEAFLANLADQGIAAQVAEDARIAATEAARVKEADKQAQIDAFDQKYQDERVALVASLADATVAEVADVKP